MKRNNSKARARLAASLAAAGLFLTLACFGIASSGRGPAVACNGPAIDGTPRTSSDPIIDVSSNAELAAVADSGSGTELDPYVIENKTIDALNTGYAIRFRYTNAHVVIRNCTVTKAMDAGILLENVQNVNISGNNVSGNWHDGIRLSSSHSCVVVGNNVSGNKNGVYMENSNHNIVSNNTITGNSQNGIHFFLHCENNTLSGNIITNNTWNGFYMDSQCSYNTLSGNVIAGNGQNGIISVNMGGFHHFSTSLTVSANTITNNSWSGILLNWVEMSTLSSNNISGNGGSGIVFQENCERSSAWNNTVSGNGGNGIFFESGSYFITISNNTVSGNTQHGIRSDWGFALTIEGNNISHNAQGGDQYHGIFMNPGGMNSVIKNSIAGNGIVQADCTGEESENAWDNGTMGNYWGDYEARYPGAENDGQIWDTPYVISPDSQDNYPLVIPPVFPARVTGLVATGGNQHVALEWAASDAGTMPITTYNVYRSTTENGPYTLVGTNTSQTGYNDTAVLNGTGYFYMVAAENFFGEGARSGIVPATTWGVPGQVTGLVAAGGYQHVALEWDAPGDGGMPIIAYNVYRSNTSGGEYTLIGTNASQTGYNDTAVLNGTGYFYKVAAENYFGEGENSTVVSATTWGLPGQVTGLVATGGNQHVALEWDAPGDGGMPITAYNVYRSNTSGGDYTLIGTNTSQTGYNDTAVLNGTGYYYMVAAENFFGEGENSTAEPAATWDLPGAPVALSVEPGIEQVTLAWTAPASDGNTAIFEYRVYCSTRGLIGVNSSETGFIDTGLSNGTTYIYHVTAVNNFGEGPASESNSTTTWDVPGQVTGLVATGGDQHVALEWDAPGTGGTPITAYNIYRSNAPDGDYVLIGTNSSETGHVDTGVLNKTGYFYKVAGMNVVGEGTNSSMALATTWGVPDQVTGLTATGAIDQIALSWLAPASGGPPITVLNVYRSDSLAGNYLFIGTNSSDTGFVDSGLGNGTTRFYVVAAGNYFGEGSNSTVASARTWSVPAQVTGLVATIGDGQVMLSWTAPFDGGSPITGYKIYRNGVHIHTVSADSTTWVNTGLPNGLHYAYFVVATNDMGDGQASFHADAVPAPELDLVTILATWLVVVSVAAGVLAVLLVMTVWGHRHPRRRTAPE